MAEITEVRLALAENEPPDSQVLAYGSVVLDDQFVIHDIKVIRGKCGPFVSMPSRKERYPCWHCKEKQPYDAQFCSCCGAPKPLNLVRNLRPHHHDIANPITQEFRAYIEQVLLDELERVTREANNGLSNELLRQSDPAMTESASNTTPTVMIRP